MIAVAPPFRSVPASAETHEAFARMTPSIRTVASYEFRRVPRWCREELINDAIARAYVAFAALAARGKTSVAYPSVLGRFAVKQIRSGRQLGCRQNVNEVLSPHAQRVRKFQVQSQQGQATGTSWEDLVQGRGASPAEIAACRIDFRSWLSQLGSFQRQIALRLAAGDTPGEAARRFQLSPARISQIRVLLREDWDKYQGVPWAA